MYPSSFILLLSWAEKCVKILSYTLNTKFHYKELSKTFKTAMVKTNQHDSAEPELSFLSLVIREIGFLLEEAGAELILLR